MLDSNGKILIVIPAFNEAMSLPTVIAEVNEFLPAADIVVVSDGSRDKTADIARHLGAAVLDLPINLGVGGAIRAGFKYAVRNSYSVAVQIDADGQHNPADAPKLIAALRDADMVIGARFAGSGDYEVTGPRMWAMKLLSAVLSSKDNRLTDTTSGFKAVGVNALKLFSMDLPAEYLGDTVEAIVIGRKAGLRIVQVPVSMRARTAGTPSQSKWKSFVYLMRVMVALALANVRPSASQD